MPGSSVYGSGLSMTILGCGTRLQDFLHLT
jgi:hypothetical protein